MRSTVFDKKTYFVHNCRLIHFCQTASWQQQRWPPGTAYITQQNEHTSFAVAHECGQIVAVTGRKEQQDLTGSPVPVPVPQCPSPPPPVYCGMMSQSCTAYLCHAKRQRELWMPAQSNQGPLERSWMWLVEGGRNVAQWELRISPCLDK